MKSLIDINSYPVNIVLSSLLKDKTTKKNIIFATNAYSDNDIDEHTQITIDVLKGLNPTVIQPRVTKSLEQQAQRTRKKAEVFTPSWICNKMNNHCDEEWFGRANVFNTELEQDWVVNESPIAFTDTLTWQKYVDSKRLEITCGEAPYIVSRYDASTGDIIPIQRRIGILDRKLRVVAENTDNEDEWLKWAYRAFQSVYGYEFQGDNLLIARINLLVTFVDYMSAKLNRVPTKAELNKITNIIVWNIWQMDGISGTIPFGKPIEHEDYQQLSLFDFVVSDTAQMDNKQESDVYCRIYDWRSNKSVEYRKLREGN